MQIVTIGGNLHEMSKPTFHEMSKPVFWEKKKKKKKKKKQENISICRQLRISLSSAKC